MLTFPHSKGTRDQAEAANLWRVRYLSVPLALLQLATIVAEIIVSVAFQPKYNWVTNTISELGVRACTQDFDPRKGVEACSPLAGVMNGAMVFSGLCLILLALVLRRSRGFAKFAGVLWGLAGVGSIVTGFISLDTSPVLHQLVSMPLFFGGPLAIVVGAFQFSGRIRLAGVSLGAFTLILGVLFSATDWVYGFGGIIERMVIWSALAWVVFVAVMARKEASAGARSKVLAGTEAQ